MPPPIVPAPMTPPSRSCAAACPRARRGSCWLRARRRTRGAARCDSGVNISSRKISRSKARPSSKRLRHRRRHRIDALQRRREVLRHRLHRVARELEVGVGVRMRRLQVAHARQRPLLGDIAGELRGAVDQVAVDDARRTASAAESAASSSLFTGSPETIMLSAVSTPTTRGSRCVPPAPGRSRASPRAARPACPARRRGSGNPARARGRRPCTTE